MKRSFRQRETNLTETVHKTREIRAYEKLATLDKRMKQEKYANVPSEYIPKSKFTDRTANGLANMIIIWFQHNGHKAWRQGSEGRYRPGEQVTDVIGRVRQMKGTWLPGQNNGQSDVAAVCDGQFVAIEVKKADQQSEAQKKYQKEITGAGGIYVIARSFGQFMDWYESEFG